MGAPGTLLLDANHNLTNAYLLFGDASGGVSDVTAIALGSFIAGGSHTITAPMGLTSNMVFTVMGVYDTKEWDVTVALPKPTAQQIINVKTWDEVFSVSEDDAAWYLLQNDVDALKQFFVTQQSHVGFTQVGQTADLVKFCIGKEGGDVTLVIPEPTAATLAGLGVLGMLLARRR